MARDMEAYAIEEAPDHSSYAHKLSKLTCTSLYAGKYDPKRSLVNQLVNQSVINDSSGVYSPDS